MARKNAILILAALLLALSAIVPLAAFAGTYEDAAPDGLSPRAFLDQFQARQFPNERPPRDDQVVAQAAGVEVDSVAIDDWYADFYAKKEKGGPNPIAYARRAEALAQAEAQGLSPMAAGLSEIGTAKMLMIPFEFNGSDDIPVCEDDLETPVLDDEGNPVVDTITGPLHGTIPDPSLEGDNNSVWTDDFSIEWYEEMMFGDGVGVVRTDLNDGAGVDLSGVSARIWYEQQSEGMYTIDGDIYPQWIQLDHSVAYYGWDGDKVNPAGTGHPCGGTQSGWGFEFTIDVVNKLNEIDPDFDWAQYDVDGDGIVDHLMVIHAGIDNSAGGGEYGNYQLWAHSWDVYCPDAEGNLTPGCLVDDGGTPADPDDDIYVSNYTHIPEDADIGVVVHEYGHDIGLPDYYDQTRITSNSTAHWIVMSGGSWSGELGGSHPAAFNPWARYFFGWADPLRVNYDDPAGMYMIGQSDPTPEDTEDSVWIDLPDQAVSVDNPAGEGKGLHAVLGNEIVHTLTRSFGLTDTVTPVFTFDTFFAIEENWDYTYVRASTDGENWDLLLNNEGIYATTDPNGSFAYLGEGGLTGEYEGSLTYDLSAYNGGMIYLQFAYVTDAAVQDPGIWIDNLSLDDGDTNFYFNDLEDSSDWTNDGWEEVPYSELSSHYYILEWRNDTGSIANHGLTEQYYSLAHDGDGWMVDKFSANVPGLVVWYRNNMYTNNQAVNGGRESAPPAMGPKGELLLVDSHSDPVEWSGGWWDPDAEAPGTAFSNRSGAMDGAFGQSDAPAWMIHDYADSANEVMDVGSRGAVTTFHDSMRSVPGWVFPGDGSVYYADRSSSVVIPASGDYSTRIRGLAEDGRHIGDDISSFWWRFAVGGQDLGPGNPGDSNVQYGIHATVMEQAEDGTYGTVKIWNAMNEFEGGISQTASADPLMYGDTVDVEVAAMNVGGAIDGVVMIPLDANEAYVSGSVWGGAMPLTVAQTADLAAQRGIEAPVFAAAVGDSVVAIGWVGALGTGDSMNFGFSTEVTTYSGSIHHSASIFDESHFVYDLHSGVLEVVDDGIRMVSLPLVADTWVNGGDEGANFDGYAVLTTRTSGLDNILLTFDRSALADDVTIVDAALKVYVDTESGAFGKSLNVLNVDAFDSTTVTYADAPATYNPSDAVAVALGELSFDVTAQIAAWEDGSQLAIASGGPFGRVSIDSLESYQAMPAILMVTYSIQ